MFRAKSVSLTTRAILDTALGRCEVHREAIVLIVRLGPIESDAIGGDRLHLLEEVEEMRLTAELREKLVKNTDRAPFAVPV